MSDKTTIEALRQTVGELQELVTSLDSVWIRAGYLKSGKAIYRTDIRYRIKTAGVTFLVEPDADEMKEIEGRI